MTRTGSQRTRTKGLPARIFRLLARHRGFPRAAGLTRGAAESKLLRTPGAPEPNGAPLLELRGISKRFDVTQALKDVSLEVPQGTIYGIAGLNGSGKSTLLRVIGGIVEPDAGTVILNTAELRLKSPRDAIDHGIALVHQELSLAPSLTPLENIFLGHEITRHFMLDWDAMRAIAGDIFSRLGVSIDLRCKTKELPVADQQIVEIAKALSLDPRLICLDEPTSALNEQEVERLFAVLRSMKAAGKTMIFVGHNINELATLCDEVAVLSGGSVSARFNGTSLSASAIAAALFGGVVSAQRARTAEIDRSKPVLRLRGLTGRRFQDVNLDLHHGEVVGLFGLVGSGVEDIPAAIFGIRKATGEIEIRGRKVSVKTPAQAKDCGIAYIPPDRRTQGLFLEKGVLYNTSLPVLDQLSRGLILQRSRERERVSKALREVQVTYSHLDQLLKNLSGGNQQKVLVSKWLTIDPQVILAHEPFRGIDIVTKRYLKEKFHQLAALGIGILIVSSELEEILDACDRIVVMKNRSVVGEFASEAFDAAQILLAAS